MTERRGRRGPGAPPTPLRVGYARAVGPAGPVDVACTERGVLYVGMPACGPEALLQAIRRRFGRRLGAVALEPLPPEEAARWQQALDRWTRTGEAPPLDLRWVTPFERRVMEAVRAIPRGQVRTYAQVASALGRPGAARAVGQVMARNPLPLFVPCHRVVPAGGGPGSYSAGGPTVKARLLSAEGAAVSLSHSSTSARARSSASSQKAGRVRSAPR